MKNKDFVAKLKKLNACSDAVEWVGTKDFETAWNECVRADWLLWLVCRMEIGTREERIHAICDCAAIALKYVPKGEDKPCFAIEAARRYADERTPENLKRLNAVRADAWDAVWAAVWDAAWDAAWAAAWAAAGDAAGDAAGAAAGAAAGDATHKKMCKLIRKRITP